jgi:uncharacterized protein YcbK (DUF882 family)
MILLSEHFYQDEFTCKCGRAECDAPLLPDPTLVAALETMRRKLGRAINITSGIRCAYWNAKQGGVANSAHVTGHAADIACPDSRYRYELLHVLDFKRIGIGATFVHVDTSPTLDQGVCWVYA